MSNANDAKEEFLERVAIMTIDGEQSEAVAVKHAYFRVRDRYGREALPNEVVDAYAKVMRGEA